MSNDMNLIDNNLIISKTDKFGIITYVNDNFCRTSGYDRSELIGKSHNIMKHPHEKKEVFKKLWKTIRNKEPYRCIIKNIRKNGTPYIVDTQIMPIMDEGEITGYMSVRNDVTSIIPHEEQLKNGLDGIESPILAIISIEEMDTLKRVFNFEAIDILKKEIKFLISYFCSMHSSYKDVYALPDGSFAILKKFDKEKSSKRREEIFLHRLKKNIENFYFDITETHQQKLTLKISFSIEDKQPNRSCLLGLNKIQNKEESIINATNMYEMSKDVHKKNIEKLNMVKKALDEQRVVSYYQPIIDNESGEIIKYESLIRIIQEDGKVISPFFFLDVAKNSSYYSKLTQRVLENSMKKIKEDGLAVSINLSLSDFQNKRIKNFLLDKISDPQYKNKIMIEILEDELNVPESTIEFIRECQEKYSVRIAIDDFGTGYSNYERISILRPDILKIDGSLIKKICDSSFHYNLVKAMVSFSDSQGIRTIAEFVSSEEIHQKVKELGITYSQGYHLGEPKP